MTNTVFYSWQNDLPNPTNRTFIENAIKAAIKEIEDVPGNDVDLMSALRDNELKFDKDTQGVSGSPPIVDVIFDKITACAIFVPDLTFIGKSEKGRLISNPNVLVEYGWALSTVSHRPIVPIMNAHYGEPTAETLPFNMRHLRHPFAYQLKPKATAEEKSAAKKALVGYLVKQFRAVLESGLLDEGDGKTPKTPTEKIDQLKAYLSNDQDRINLHDLVHDEAERTYAAIDKDDLLAIPNDNDLAEFRRRARVFETETVTLRGMLATGCFWGRPEQARI
ncbi:MAG TPA: hypothetical protein VM325_13745 [Alphaproteobacteria bacterium]|nr:hypothetical protein [Alphaproteobacteria bacterium]